MLAAITAPEEERWDRGVWVVEEGVKGRARGWRRRRLGEGRRCGAAASLRQRTRKVGELQKVAVAHDSVRARRAECPRGDLRLTHLPPCGQRKVAILPGMDVVHQPEVVQRVILAPVAEAHARAVLHRALQLLWSEQEPHRPSHGARSLLRRLRAGAQQSLATDREAGSGHQHAPSSWAQKPTVRVTTTQSYIFGSLHTPLCQTTRRKERPAGPGGTLSAPLLRLK